MFIMGDGLVGYRFLSVFNWGLDWGREINLFFSFKVSLRWEKDLLYLGEFCNENLFVFGFCNWLVK